MARHYCLITGWGASYPETTGYIVPTIIREAQAAGDTELLQRGRRMLDWLVSIQMPGGGFRGGVTGDGPAVPVTFNTGQILLGLAAGVRHFGPAYRPAMIAAADWLVQTQDDDGCWRKHGTPFAKPGEKVYETHVAWGLYEAARVEPGRGYAEAASKNLAWALSHQTRQWLVRELLPDRSRESADPHHRICAARPGRRLPVHARQQDFGQGQQDRRGGAGGIAARWFPPRQARQPVAGRGSMVLPDRDRSDGSLLAAALSRDRKPAFQGGSASRRTAMCVEPCASMGHPRPAVR